MILAHGVGGRCRQTGSRPEDPQRDEADQQRERRRVREQPDRQREVGTAAGRGAPGWLDGAGKASTVVAQVAFTALFVTTLVAAWFGVDSVAANLAPTALYVVFWVGMQVVSALFGDVWRRANPLWVVAALFDRIAGRDPETSTATGIWASHWPAAAGLGVFLWLELAYHEPGSTTAVGIFLGAYTVFVLAGATRFGAGWVRSGDGFAVLFTLLAALAPFHRDDSGRLRLRWPGAGLANVEPRPGTLGVCLLYTSPSPRDRTRSRMPSSA